MQGRCVEAASSRDSLLERPLAASAAAHAYIFTIDAGKGVIRIVALVFGLDGQTAAWRLPGTVTGGHRLAGPLLTKEKTHLYPLLSGH